MMKREGPFTAKNVLKFIALLVLVFPLTLVSCSSSGGDDDEDWGEDLDPEYREICEHVAKAANQICDIYDNCHSIADLSEYEEDIRNIRYVEDVWFSNTTMFVDIKDYGTIMYSFFPKLNAEDYELQEVRIRQNFPTRADDPSHPLLELETAIIVNQAYKDEDRKAVRDMAEMTGKMLSSCGIKCTPNNSPSMSFFQNELFDYDIVFLITHGDWTPGLGVHWLLTSETATEDEYQKIKASDIYKYKDFPRDEVTVWQMKELRNNKWENVWYVAISEKYIDASEKEFSKQGKTIFFNIACRSMMGGNIYKEDKNTRNRSLANMLKEKGVGFYLGYDESNNVGQRAGMLFFGKLASGMSVRNAYESLPNSCLHNTMSDNVYYWNPDLKVVEYGEKTWVADLVPFYSEKNVQIGASRITGPVLGEFKDNSNSVQLRVELQATSPLYTYHYQSYLSNADKIYGENFTFDKFRYGFEYGTKEDFSDATKTIGMAVNTPGCIHTENIVRYTQTLTSDKLTPSTTYYYRAYFYDGYDYYYTNSDTFTTKDLPVDTDTQLPDVPGSDF